MITLCKISANDLSIFPLEKISACDLLELYIISILYLIIIHISYMNIKQIVVHILLLSWVISNFNLHSLYKIDILFNVTLSNPHILNILVTLRVS